MTFPADFLWGAASSSYQIEGGAGARGVTIWDDFCRQPGAVYEGHSGEIACDHYNRMAEDVALMRELGLRAYRFSIAWARVIPEGTGTVNQTGLDFYSRLVDDLLAAGIQPWVTLFHWDYPTALYHRGGWLNRDSAAWFADYCSVVADRLSDRVRHWMTLNEPQVFLKYGHGDGTNAPGLRLPVREQLLAAHHTLLAHGLGVQAIRAHAKTKPECGWAVVCVVKFPATEAPADVEAARRATMSIPRPDLWNNTWYNDPVFFGRYPEDGLRAFGGDVPRFPASDLATIRQPMDFIGLNIYTGDPVRAGAGGEAEEVVRTPGHPVTAIRWPVEPESLRWGPRFTHERYKVPVYITENGCSNVDWVHLDGRVHDPQRIDLLTRYLRALRRAIAEGADVRGYFHWSIMDNFEWSQGYRERFGLVHVDYGTQRRTPKDSFAWYRSVIESNGAGIGGV